MDLGVEVIGVSGDQVENQKLFKKVHKLNFTLLADPTGAVAKQFGVPIKAGGTFNFKLDGENFKLDRGVTTARWTFVIDQNGNIAYKDTKVNAADDSKKIQEVVSKLKAG